MTIKIAIIGLGQIGSSIGLALSSQKEYIYRIGHDKDYETARAAKKMDAVDSIERNLIQAVQKSNVVILSIPVDQIQETLKQIGTELNKSTIVIDTASIKTPIKAWATEFIPEGCYYVGLTPVINPKYLHGTNKGIKAAHKDLFENGLMMIVAGSNTNSDALKFTSDFTHLLGAEPFFTDALEVDGFMATTHILPQLTSAALINASTLAPGWQDARKIAGVAYAEVTAPLDLLDDVSALHASTKLNKENMVRVLDNTIAALQTIRDDIAKEEFDNLLTLLNQASQVHSQWLGDRQAKSLASYDKLGDTNLPASKGIISRLFGMNPPPKEKKKD